MTGVSLIVGLGNPGAEYENTRHNAGVWFVNDIAQATQTQLKREAKYHGLHGVTKFHDHECHLLIPTTFMNVCGISIQALANYYKISPQSILVAHDEVDLPVGIVRLKFDGGHGGHNGLRDIISHLHTNQFHRLRIGVGRPANGEDTADYVLSPPKKTERTHINQALQQACDVMPLMMTGKFQQAMHALHTIE